MKTNNQNHLPEGEYQPIKPSPYKVCQLRPINGIRKNLHLKKVLIIDYKRGEEKVLVSLLEPDDRLKHPFMAPLSLLQEIKHW